MKNSTYLSTISTVLIMLVLTACGTEEAEQPRNDTDLNTDAAAEVITPIDNTEWELLSLRGEAIELSSQDRPTPSISFSAQEGRVLGHAGCNQFTGSYRYEDIEGLSFGQIARTKMMCPDMEVENKYMAVLEETADFTITGDNLILLSETGEELAVFQAVHI